MMTFPNALPSDRVVALLHRDRPGVGGARVDVAVGSSSGPAATVYGLASPSGEAIAESPGRRGARLSNAAVNETRT